MKTGGNLGKERHIPALFMLRNYRKITQSQFNNVLTKYNYDYMKEITKGHQKVQKCSPNKCLSG